MYFNLRKPNPLQRERFERKKEMWNNHSIRRQKLRDTIPGILDVLFHNPEIFGASKYLYTVPENMSISLLRLVRNDHLQMDGDFYEIGIINY